MCEQLKTSVALSTNILFITPPFTQLNTPYPATAYLKGFLNTQGIPSHQADLGIDVILALFSPKGLAALFQELDEQEVALSDNGYRICCLQKDYISTIGPVIRFLQHKNPTLAHSICDRTYLPEASRFQALDDLDWAFGTMGIHDKARHLATLYLEDLADLITEAVDPHFGFSRYAERLGRSATHFQALHETLQAPNTRISTLLCEVLATYLHRWQPDVVCLTVPFPGNLYGALKCGQYIRQHYPHITVVMGGGFANTELRRLTEPRVFDYVHYICLDDGEAPLLCLLEYIAGQRSQSQLKRVFMRENGVVRYLNGATEKDVAQRDTGTPDYSDLRLMDYLSVIELVNPMHRLWSDGRWNKLTLAHGCYWGKCSFCDVTLDYIKRYEPVTASLLCDRIDEITEQTQQNGFHFVDEAAPPALMRELALEIIRRRLTVVWWTNIRFEASFTPDLCRLLKASGCIAISGGLEVASDRLLDRMKKGVTVAQVARVAQAFTDAGIMVHAYLMYGFPTQTVTETVDSLEMVRQLFQQGVVQSGFWHRFAMTAHSPVGQHPAEFDVMRIGPDFGGFADNDLEHEDPLGAHHDLFAEGLRKSLFNYMHGVCFEFPLQEWFDFQIPPPSISPDYIEISIQPIPDKVPRLNAVLIWLGNGPTLDIFAVKRGRKTVEVAELTFTSKHQEWGFETNAALGRWLTDALQKLVPGQPDPIPYQQVKADYETANLGDFAAFTHSAEWQLLRKNGLLVL